MSIVIQSFVNSGDSEPCSEPLEIFYRLETFFRDAEPCSEPLEFCGFGVRKKKVSWHGLETGMDQITRTQHSRASFLGVWRL